MRRRLANATVFLLVCVGTIKAQSSSGGLAGTVSYPEGSFVAQAPIQLQNKETGAVARASSAANGRYSFTGLAPGFWEFSVAVPCCAYARFTKVINIERGKTAELNVRLVETINGSTLGDDPGRLASLMVQRNKVPSGPAPRTREGKPDLSGIWVVTNDPFPQPPEVMPWVEAIVKQRATDVGKDHPHNHCLPGSPPVPASSAPFIAKMVQTPGLIVMLFEDNPGFRQIFIDGRSHPADFDPSWMGHSTGKWEGDTLVVDTVGFNERIWIGPPQGLYPHTAKLHLIERYRRPDLGHIEVQATFEDPGAFVKPLRETEKWDLAPQEELLEYVCENNKPEHLVGK
ncbi:MAG TPA: carboxypeptidase-like regulatory domain-containing protein [Bryobacteraceae bacterium]|nr:carboxypeptidase-like regulatory domain-containing protein [Bryobacteraceae bacterium]